jgi:Zinc finger C-x8-C-x5-C-x3-H type (and similar)
MLSQGSPCHRPVYRPSAVWRRSDSVSCILQGRFYAGRPINIEFSPVTDFREATCRQYEENTCTRGGYCNFMHLRPISRDLRKQLFGRYKRREGDGRDDRCKGPRVLLHILNVTVPPPVCRCHWWVAMPSVQLS